MLHTCHSPNKYGYKLAIISFHIVVYSYSIQFTIRDYFNLSNLIFQKITYQKVEKIFLEICFLKTKDLHRCNTNIIFYD